MEVLEARVLGVRGIRHAFMR